MSAPGDDTRFRGKIHALRGTGFGTAWLLTPRYVVTAQHCVGSAVPGADSRFRVSFPHGEEEATLVWADTGLDAAILDLRDRAVSEEIPLPRPGRPGRDSGARWHADGFPRAKGDGMRLSGSVTAWDGTVEGEPAIQLSCDQGGHSGLEGASGAAVLVGGRAVGLIRWAPPQLQQTVVYAVPLDALARRLPEALLSEHPRLAEVLGPLASRPRCPYVGLRPFTEAESPLFFGRDRERARALRLLDEHPFLAVIGPSGSGKSSFVRASLLPELARAARGGEPPVQVTFRPGPDPLAALTAAFETADVPEALLDPELSPELPGGRSPTLYADQFEEVFTLPADPDRRAFFSALQRLLDLATGTLSGRLRLVLSLRADFYPEIMGSPLWEPVQAHRLELTELGGEALHDVIVQPARGQGVELDGRLVERLVQEATAQPSALPLLQETLVLLWREASSPSEITLEDYDRIGGEARSGLGEALRRHADSVFAGLPGEEHRRLARVLFLRLIQFGSGRADTRRTQTLPQLRDSTSDLVEGSLLAECLEHLVEGRLLTRSGEGVVDLGHEQLITAWPRLRSWIDEIRSLEVRKRKLEEQVADWNRLDRKGGLLDEIQLEEAEEWLEHELTASLGVPAGLRGLIDASEQKLEEDAARLDDAARELEEAEVKRRKVLGVAAVLTAFLGMFGVAGTIPSMVWESIPLPKEHLDSPLHPIRDFAVSSSGPLRVLARARNYSYHVVPGSPFRLEHPTDARLSTEALHDQLTRFLRRSSRFQDADLPVGKLVFDVLGPGEQRLSGGAVDLVLEHRPGLDLLEISRRPYLADEAGNPKPVQPDWKPLQPSRVEYPARFLELPLDDLTDAGLVHAGTTVRMSLRTTWTEIQEPWTATIEDVAESADEANDGRWEEAVVPLIGDDRAMLRDPLSGSPKPLHELAGHLNLWEEAVVTSPRWRRFSDPRRISRDFSEAGEAIDLFGEVLGDILRDWVESQRSTLDEVTVRADIVERRVGERTYRVAQVLATNLSFDVFLQRQLFLYQEPDTDSWLSLEPDSKIVEMKNVLDVFRGGEAEGPIFVVVHPHGLIRSTDAGKTWSDSNFGDPRLSQAERIRLVAGSDPERPLLYVEQNATVGSTNYLFQLRERSLLERFEIGIRTPSRLLRLLPWRTPAPGN